jgi:hypothetical protein
MRGADARIAPPVSNGKGRMSRAEHAAWAEEQRKAAARAREEEEEEQGRVREPKLMLGGMARASGTRDDRERGREAEGKEEEEEQEEEDEEEEVEDEEEEEEEATEVRTLTAAQRPQALVMWSLLDARTVSRSAYLAVHAGRQPHERREANDRQSEARHIGYFVDQELGEGTFG